MWIQGRLLLALTLLVAMHAGGQVTAPQPDTTAGPQPKAVAPDKAPYRNDPKFMDTLKEAKSFQQKKQALYAADAYKKANKIAGGRCIECLQGLFTTQMMQGGYKDAMATASALEALVTLPSSKSVAATYHGEATLAQGGTKPKPEQLAAAHADFQAAIAAYPKNVDALFWDGKVLATMGKLEEARVDFQQCLACIQSSDPFRLRVEHFSENPELAAHKMAPAFEVTALDGSKFNLDNMGGRVVLIDFWATWCGPCNEELPHMKKIAKEFAGQPLVMISVSWDNDEEKWKQFIQKNDMTWVQYRDADHNLSNLFQINAIPHYFTIDSDGVLTAEMLGEGSDVEGKLKKLLKKAREAQAVTPVTSTVSPKPALGGS